MEQLWKRNLLDIEPYVAGEQPPECAVKLNANENPYPPSPKVAEVLRNFNSESLKKYPSITALELRTALGKRIGLSPEQVFVGNGSDDVLATAFRAFFNSDKPIVYPDVTYSFYPVWCDLLNIKYKTAAVDENFKINPQDYYEPNGGVVIANPNAPTSLCEPLEFIEDILRHNTDCVVIADEAYIDFGGKSAVGLVNKYENLLVVQTSSKSRSLAGMRVGMAFGSKTLIDTLSAVKDSYNSYPLDSVAQAVMLASVEDEEYFTSAVKKIITTRESVSKSLEDLGFEVLDSKTNFVFAKHNSKNAKDIFEYLKSKGVYVRYFNKPRISDYLRITIGTDEEMKILLSALKEYI